MSVPEQTPYIQYTGNGVTTVFPYPFQILDSDDLAVFSDGVRQSIGSQYTIDGVGNQAGGQITFLTAPVSGAKLLVFREMTLERDTDYQTNGDLREAVLDRDFNRIWMILQGQDASLGTALRMPFPEQSAEVPALDLRKGKMLAFDPNTGQPTIAVPTSDSAQGVRIDLANGTSPNGAAMVTLPNGSLVSDIVGENGGNNIGYKYPSTFSVKRVTKLTLDDRPIPVEEFAEGMGEGSETKDTDGFQLAVQESQSTGRIIYPGESHRQYLIADTLDIVATPSPTSYKVARFRGAGRNSCTLKFVGGATDQYAISAIGNRETSAGSSAAHGVEFGGFYLDGTDWLGHGIRWENIGLWSYLRDLKIWSFAGRGIDCIANFDHVWQRIEARACGGVGIYMYEPQPSDEGGFREQSFLRVQDVHAIGNNSNGTQWIVDGGNAYTFDKIKPSEGVIGIDCTRLRGASFYDTYVDGTTAISGSENIGIRLGSGCLNNNIRGGRFWNTHKAVQQTGGGYSDIGPIYVDLDSPAGANVYSLHIASGVTSPVTHVGLARVLDESTVGAGRNAYNSIQSNLTLTFTGLTLGSGSYVAKSQINGRDTELQVRITLAADSSASGIISFGLPAAADTTATMPIQATYYDASASRIYNGRFIPAVNGLGGSLYFEGTSNGALPVTLGAGDVIWINGKYRRLQ